MRWCSCPCCGARSAFNVQRVGVDVVIVDNKGSPPGACNSEAEPHCVVNSFIVFAAVTLVVALLSLCSFLLESWERAFARQASGKVLVLADACSCIATSVAWSSGTRAHASMVVIVKSIELWLVLSP